MSRAIAEGMMLATLVALVVMVVAYAGSREVDVDCQVGDGVTSTHVPRRNITKTSDGYVVEVPGLPPIVAEKCEIRQ